MVYATEHNFSVCRDLGRGRVCVPFSPTSLLLVTSALDLGETITAFQDEFTNVARSDKREHSRWGDDEVNGTW